MPTWRKLHTKTVESFDVNDMPDDFTRLLWVLLPTQLCREGRGPDSPAWVRSSVFPLREDVTLDAVSAALDWFANRGMIERYEVDGRRYFYVPSFHRHQGNTSKEAESIYPDPPGYSRPTPELLPTDSGPTPDLLPTDSSTDADADADVEADTDASKNPPECDSDYQEIRKAWIELFPDKPKPRENNRTLRGKAKTRMKSAYFRDHWHDALVRASGSRFLHAGGWFDLAWFLKNDENYEKCLNGNYDDSGNGGNSRPPPEAPKYVPDPETGLY